MKNTLKLFLFAFSLCPFLLSSQTLSRRAREVDSLYTIADPLMAFRIKVPLKKALLYPTVHDNQVRSKMYYGTDSAENTRYFFGLRVFLPGVYVPDDSSYYSWLKKGLEAQFKHLIRDSVYFEKGYFVEDLYGTTETGGRYMAYRHIARGNSAYVLLADFPQPGLTAKVKAFFNSFSMLDYPVQAWHQTIDPDSSLTTWTPTPLFAYNADSSKDHPVETRSYLAFDSIHYNSYRISRLPLTRYFWSTSDSALCAQLTTLYLLPTDSVVYRKLVSNGDARGWEWVRKPRNGSMYQRERVLLNGDRLYYLYTVASKDDVASPNTNRFFEDFRFVRPMEKTHAFDSKADALLNDLFGPDPAAAAKALACVGFAPFVKKDLPRLHSLMLKLPDFRGRLNDYDIDALLANRIVYINDSSSFRWAAAHYKTLTVSQDYIKGFLLTIMGNFPSPAHYSEMAGLLQNSPPKILTIDFVSMLGKHLRETARIMPQLLALPAADSGYKRLMIELAGKLADSNLLTAAKLVPFQSYLLRYASVRTVYLTAHLGSPQKTDGALISLLGLLNTDASNAALREYLDMDFHDERIKAFTALLRNGKQKAEDIQGLAKDKSTRLDLYRILEKEGKLQLFPAAYRTQN